jgi:membrane protease YdiL (CAAX protease family)
MPAHGAHVTVPAKTATTGPTPLRRVAAFYLLTFAVSWSAWGAMAAIHRGGEPGPLAYVFSTLGGLGPLLALALLERRTGGAVSLRRVLAGIRLRGPGRAWWWPAALAWPGIVLLAEALNAVLGRSEGFRPLQEGPAALGWPVVFAIAAHFLASLVTSPLFEEPGWRGFALRPLQDRYGRLLGSLAVGVAWWIWHQPMNLTFGLAPTLDGAATMVLLSFTIDSLYRLSRDNVASAMLAHQSMGTVLTFLSLRPGDPIRLALLCAWVVSLRWLESRASRAA